MLEAHLGVGWEYAVDVVVDSPIDLTVLKWGELGSAQVPRPGQPQWYYTVAYQEAESPVARMRYRRGVWQRWRTKVAWSRPVVRITSQGAQRCTDFSWP